MTHLIFAQSAAVLTAAFLFGGGASLSAAGDVAPQMLALPLLYHVMGPGWRRLQDEPLIKLWIVGAVGLILLQLVPLPPSIWTALPGRAPIVAMIVSPDAQPGWMSLSLRPQQTLKVLFQLLPPLALFLAMVAMDLKRRIWLLGVMIGLVLLEAVIGMAQMLNGPESPLYFHQFATRGRAVGFFANPNHYAAPFYAAVPLLTALAASASGRHARLLAGVLAAAVFACLVGLSMSGSRTALLLGGVSLIASLVVLARSGVANLIPGRRRLAAIAGLAGLVLIPVLMGVGLLAILDRLETQDVFDDLRWRVLPVAIEQAFAYLPFGAGLGVFEKAYALNESVALLIPSYVNHVHNDWAEVFFEAGAAGLLLMGLAVLILLRMSAQAMMHPAGLSGRLLAGGVVSVWLLLAHSLWDYPLRTQACLAVLALAVSLGVAPAGGHVETLADVLPGSRRRRRRSRRHVDAADAAA